MFGTAIIIFREVLEAALIVGLVLAATRGVGKRIRWISAGIGGGVLGAMLLALAADQIGSMAHGMGQEVLNASILFAAVLMLSWHLLWMKSHSIEMTKKLRQVGNAVSTGDKEPVVLAVIIGLAILREGSEAVLFLYGLAAAGTNLAEMFSGTMLGLLAGIAAGSVLYLGIARIPTGKLFQVSGWLILLLTAGLATQAVAFLVQADILPAMGYAIWDSSSLLSESGVVGRVLHILVGYVDKPMGIQILTYLLTVGILVSAMSYINRQDQRTRTLRNEGSPTL